MKRLLLIYFCIVRPPAHDKPSQMVRSLFFLINLYVAKTWPQLREGTLLRLHWQKIFHQTVLCSVELFGSDRRCKFFYLVLIIYFNPFILDISNLLEFEIRWNLIQKKTTTRTWQQKRLQSFYVKENKSHFMIICGTL